MPPAAVAGCIQLTYPMTSVSIASQPNRMATTPTAAARAIGKFANTAIAAARRLPPTATEDQAGHEVAVERTAFEPFGRNALGSRHAVIATSERVECAECEETTQ